MGDVRGEEVYMDGVHVCGMQYLGGACGVRQVVLEDWIMGV